MSNAMDVGGSGSLTFDKRRGAFRIPWSFSHMLVVDLQISPQSEYTRHDFAFPVLEGATQTKYEHPPSIPPKGLMPTT